jgi:hypothetical protein
VSCHRDDALRHATASPAHAGYSACANCHNPNSWLINGAPGGAFGRESVCL